MWLKASDFVEQNPCGELNNGVICVKNGVIGVKFQVSSKEWGDSGWSNRHMFIRLCRGGAESLVQVVEKRRSRSTGVLSALMSGANISRSSRQLFTQKSFRVGGGIFDPVGLQVDDELQVKIINRCAGAVKKRSMLTLHGRCYKGEYHLFIGETHHGGYGDRQLRLSGSN